jgi:heavy metal translocating P-type ATPase
MPDPGASKPRRAFSSESLIAALSGAGLLAHLTLRFGFHVSAARSTLPLYLVLGIGGTVLVAQLAVKLVRGEFGSDLLAGISIVTAVLLGEYLAGSLVVLMLSGGQALEQFAVGRASTALHALAQRMPSVAHRHSNGTIEDVALDALTIGDVVTIFPHDICPVDGTVVAGHGSMNESYLTGEPFMMDKGPGTDVFSGAINGEHALTVRTTRRTVDSRYARIMTVMRESEQRRPKLRRLGDQLGAVYTPVAVGLAVSAWWWSGDPVRFLAVLVVATPCPLLIAIPVAIIGSISLAARHGIIVRDPSVLEQVDRCRTIVLDKTGTLTYGEPTLTERFIAPALTDVRVLQLAASVERYSRHPLAQPVLAAARADGIPLLEATDIRERPGEGLEAIVDGHRVQIVGRRNVEQLARAAQLPESAGGLECMIVIDGQYAGLFRFRDAPRTDSPSFIGHLWSRHSYNRVLLVSGDREQEVRYLADLVGIRDVLADQSPEDKVAITRTESALAPTVFIGDGINDAPALATATVGIAFGNQSQVTSEAAGVVIMDSSLARVDELFHIGRRMRRIALQSAVGGMALSAAGMLLAFGGALPPVSGAVFQELIDLGAVLNALRASKAGGALSDF